VLGRVALPYKLLGLALIMLLLPISASADLASKDLKDTVIAVNAYRGKTKSTFSGVVVQGDLFNGYVVANAALIENVDTLTVTVPKTGAELVALVVKSDVSLDLVLLKVNGLSLPPMVFGLDSPLPGDVVWSVARWDSAEQSIALAKGNLQSKYKHQAHPDIEVMSHTAAIGAGDIGSVLLNDCGELIGFNMTLSQPGTTTRAFDGQSLARFLLAHNVRFTRASSACVSIVMQARARADEATEAAKLARKDAMNAQRVAKAIEANLLVTNQMNQGLIKAASSARLAAESAIRAAETAQAHAEQTRMDLEKQTADIIAETEAMAQYLQQDREAAEVRFNAALEEQRESSLKREDFLIVGFVGLLGVLVVAIFIIQRAGLRPAAILEAVQSSRQAAKEAAKKSVGSAVMHNPALKEYVLDGRDEDGIRYLLRISGDQLVGDKGTIIGRNPNESPYIINHADVSRQHVRLKIMKNRVFVEDLGSTNGTAVNGQNIDGKGLVSVSNGDEIIIGSVAMKLRMVGT
jgi:hypothetical protein